MFLKTHAFGTLALNNITHAVGFGRRERTPTFLNNYAHPHKRIIQLGGFKNIAMTHLVCVPFLILSGRRYF